MIASFRCASRYYFFLCESSASVRYLRRKNCCFIARYATLLRSYIFPRDAFSLIRAQQTLREACPHQSGQEDSGLVEDIFVDLLHLSRCRYTVRCSRCLPPITSSCSAQKQICCSRTLFTSDPPSDLRGAGTKRCFSLELDGAAATTSHHASYNSPIAQRLTNCVLPSWVHKPYFANVPISSWYFESEAPKDNEVGNTTKAYQGGVVCVPPRAPVGTILHHHLHSAIAKAKPGEKTGAIASIKYFSSVLYFHGKLLAAAEARHQRS